MLLNIEVLPPNASVYSLPIAKSDTDCEVRNYFSAVMRFDNSISFKRRSTISTGGLG